MHKLVASTYFLTHNVMSSYVDIVNGVVHLPHCKLDLGAGNEITSKVIVFQAGVGKAATVGLSIVR